MSNRLLSHRAFVLGLSLLWVSSAGAQAKEIRKLELRVGEQTSISADGVRQYSEGAQGVVDVRLPKDGSQFVLVGLAPGDTTLLLIMQSGDQVLYRIHVVAREPKRETGAVEKVDNIRLDFYFVQLSDSYNHSLGLGWPGTIGGESFTAQAAFDLTSGFNVASASAVIANQVLPRLDIAQATGWARVLRRAVLITENGNQASYQSGGEVNIPIEGALTAEIRAIQFGSNVTVMPRYDRDSGRIEIHIQADVSDLTNSNGGVPGRTVSKLDTVVNLDLGQAVMLAGLSSESKGGGKSGLPFLSQIPIFGALFGTHTKREDRVQNVVFIVPTVVESVPAEARREIERALAVYREYSGDMDEVELAPEGKTGPGPKPPGSSTGRP